MRAIRKQKNNKAAGVDGILAEMVKHGGQRTEEEFIKIYEKIWEEEEIPSEWREGI